MVFVIVNNAAEEAGTFTDGEGWREVITIGAMTVCGGGFTKWANCMVLANNVFFTTVT